MKAMKLFVVLACITAFIHAIVSVALMAFIETNDWLTAVAKILEIGFDIWLIVFLIDFSKSLKKDSNETVD